MVAFHAEVGSRPIAHVVVVVACRPGAEVGNPDAYLGLEGTENMEDTSG